jgi:hypothetical protein
MRVRIINSAEGIIDGVSLAHLVTGLTYDLDPSVANYLIAKGSAEELLPSESALVIPLDNARAYVQLTRGVTVIQPRAVAADRTSRRRHPRKKR